MAQEQGQTAVAAAAEEPQQQREQHHTAGVPADSSEAPVVEAEVDPGQPGGYKIVRSPTGSNFVEADDYDPLEHHRSREPSANKGQGLGFLFCCFGSKAEPEEAAEQK